MPSRRSLLAKTLLITPSGALSPGPLTAAAVAVGSSLGLLGGLAVALGHAAFELPYVAALTRAAGRVRGLLRGGAGRALMAVMAGFTAFFAAGLSEAALKGASLSGNATLLAGGGLLGAFLLGVAYTGLNPYFLAWWATAGFPLLEESAEIPWGLAVMYPAHVWMDFAWLGLLAAGGGLAAAMGSTPYRILLGLLSLVLWYYAALFAWRALRTPGSRVPGARRG